jgi:hypothetical protein
MQEISVFNGALALMLTLIFIFLDEAIIDLFTPYWHLTIAVLARSTYSIYPLFQQEVTFPFILL